MTYLQLVNSVLRRLREDPVSYVGETSYSRLIGEFVNQAKREVESAWNWSVLRDTIRVTTEAGTFRYVLTSAGTRFRLLDVVNDTEDFFVRQAPSTWLNISLTSNNVTQGTPRYYGFNSVDTNGDPQVDLYPIPDGVYDINFNVVMLQDDLSDDNDVLYVPQHPVILGTHALAISERGEDGGVGFNEADARFQKALGEAVAFDMNLFIDEITAGVQ